MTVQDGFVDAVLASPVGVALLARLENRVRHPNGSGLALDTSPDGVEMAQDAVTSMSFGELVDLAVWAGAFDVGPWISEAAATAEAAYRHAEVRAPIAEAVSDRFGAELHAPLDRDAQQWWTSEQFNVASVAPCFREFEDVYDAGQFTWAGVWTVSDPPDVAHVQLIGAWEIDDRGPVSRWHLPIRDPARVFEVHRPDDWTKLVTEHPREASHSSGWELPNGRRADWSVLSLSGVAGQRAARTRMRRHLVPDWRSVADDYDGVHLSWAGFITGEGCITDLDGGDVTMLRYWFSERTHWLADVFGEPSPAPAPWVPNETEARAKHPEAPDARIAAMADAARRAEFVELARKAAAVRRCNKG